jgi:hypothetical protein
MPRRLRVAAVIAPLVPACTWGSSVDPTSPPETSASASTVVARWWNMYGYDGVGLRGGRFSTRGYRHVSWTLRGVRWVEDVEVDGRMT